MLYETRASTGITAQLCAELADHNDHPLTDDLLRLSRHLAFLEEKPKYSPITSEIDEVTSVSDNSNTPATIGKTCCDPCVTDDFL